MTISASEKFYPAYENGAQIKGVIGRFDFLEEEDVVASQARGERVTRKTPVLVSKTTMSPDYVPEKLPIDPIARKAMIDRFPQAWAAFQGDHVEDIGTPLSTEFKGMTLPSQERMRYEIVGITAWEQIADLSDLGCDGLGFGTKKRRNDVMRALGRVPPGEVPAMALSFGMTARDALLQMPGGDKLVPQLERMIAEHNGDVAPSDATKAAPTMPDLAHPVVQAAIQAAVEAGVKAALEQAGRAAPAKKGGGWPKGKARGKAPETDAPVTDVAA